MIRKRLTILVCTLLLLTSLSGCIRQAPSPGETLQPSEGEDSSSAPGEGQEESGSQGDLLPISDPDGFLLYLYKGYPMMTEEKLYTPLPRQVGEALSAHELALLASRGSLSSEPLLFTMQVEEEVVTIHLAEQYSPEDSSWEEQLHTLWATIRENTGRELRVLQQGEPCQPETLLVDATGLVTETALPLPNHSMEELAQLRASLNFALPTLERGRLPELLYPVMDDPVAVQITNLIYYTTDWSLPKNSFDHIASADPGFVTMAAMARTPDYSWYQGEYAGENQTPELLPLTQTCSDYEGRMQEHVEAVARLLFGDEVQVDGHAVPSPWRYDEYSGVYTPPHMGIYGARVPVVLDYADKVDHYEVTAVFLSRYFEDYVDLFSNILDPADLANYCQNTLPQHTIALRKGPDDALFYQGHQLPDWGGFNWAVYAYEAEQHLDMSVLATVVPDADQWDTGSYTFLDTDSLELDADGDLYAILPTLTGTTLAVEQAGSGEELYRHTFAQGDDSWLLYLRATQSTAADLQIRLELNGRRALYQFNQDPAPDSGLILVKD